MTVSSTGPSCCPLGAGAHWIREDKFLKEIKDSAFGSMMQYDAALGKLPQPSETSSLIVSDGAAVESFRTAISSNVFGPVQHVEENNETSTILAQYMVDKIHHLEKVPDDKFRDSIPWGDPPRVPHPTAVGPIEVEQPAEQVADGEQQTAVPAPPA